MKARASIYEIAIEVSAHASSAAFVAVGVGEVSIAGDGDRASWGNSALSRERDDFFSSAKEVEKDVEYHDERCFRWIGASVTGH